MNKSKIEWCDYTINPVKGYCPVACPYCYARRMYDRFKWDKTIRFNQLELLYGISRIRDEHPKIFVGSTIELFGEWVKSEWLESIFRWVRKFNWCTFIFLTKRPENLAKWNPWPDNCWVGVSVESGEYTYGKNISTSMRSVIAPIKFISFEPLQGSCHGIIPDWCKWVIIGAETGNRKGKPPLSEVHKWAGEIIKAADDAGIPVFLKDNLKWPIERQEFPKVRVAGRDRVVRVFKIAVFSHDRKYRYALWRIWDEKPVCMFIGLNPSTANEYSDDPTIRRCESFAGGWGYGGLCMANLFAYCSAYPSDLITQDAVGSDNDDWIRYLAAYSGIVVACWGAFWMTAERAKKVMELIPELYCLGTTKSGNPKHPLYLPREQNPVKFEAMKGEG